MDTLDYILEKYNLCFNEKTRMPIEIPNVGRDNLPDLFRELDFTVGAEVGVYCGDYSEKLCKPNPRLRLYCVDAWEGYEDYGVYDNEMLKDAYGVAQKKLSAYGCVLIKKTSMSAVEDFEDRSLDFVYIDGNHKFSYVTDDITFWSKKIRIGGIVSGHDYIRLKVLKNSALNQVIKAVKAHAWSNNIFPWFVLGSKAKLSGMTRDHHRSWMWVKSS